MAESTSKLRKQVKALTNVNGSGGVDILADEKTFRSTYDIMSDISDVWQKMSDIDQSALLELLAGKVRSNQVAALLSNFDQAEKAMKTSQSAEGTMDKVHRAWMNSVEARKAQFEAAQETLSMTAMPASTLKDLYQLGTGALNGLNWLVGKTGSGGVFAGLMGLSTALRSGNGSIAQGLGNITGLHWNPGAGWPLRQANSAWVNAYNASFNAQPATLDVASKKANAYADATSRVGALNDRYTQGLYDNADGLIDATKAAGGLGASLKSLGKNLVTGALAFGAMELAIGVATWAWNQFNDNVLHRSETLANNAAMAHAEAEQAQQVAEARKEEQQGIQEQIANIEEKSRTGGGLTSSEEAELANLRSQHRVAQYRQEIAEAQARAKSVKAVESKTKSYEWDRSQETGIGAALYDAEGGAAARDAFIKAEENASEYLKTLEEGSKEYLDTWQDIQQLQAWGEGSSYMRAAMNASSPEGQALLARYGQSAAFGLEGRYQSMVDARRQQLSGDYADIQARSEVLAKLLDFINDSDRLSPEALGEAYRFASKEYDGLMESIKQTPGAAAKLGEDENSAFSQLYQKSANVDSKLADRLDTMETGAQAWLQDYFNAGGKVSDTQKAAMTDYINSYLGLREVLQPGRKLDAVRFLLAGTPLADALMELDKLAAESKLTADSISGLKVDNIENAGQVLEAALALFGISLTQAADMWNASQAESKKETEGGTAPAKVDIYGERQASVAKAIAAQDAGSKVWSASGYTGGMTEADYQSLVDLGDEAYLAAVEYAQGGLFFNKDAFDKIVQDKYREELAGLKKDVVSAQEKYRDAANRIVEQANKAIAGGEGFDSTALSQAYTDLSSAASELSGYRRMQAQLQYNMSDYVNWLNNKNGPESGDMYSEIGQAAQAILSGKESGLIGTRQFEAAMRFYTGQENFDVNSLSKKDWELLRGAAGVDSTGAAQKGLSKQTLFNTAKELQALGILGENYGFVKPTTMDEVARRYNAAYGANTNAQYMEGVFKALNDYIQNPNDKYDLSAMETPEAKAAAAAYDKFVQAAKDYNDNKITADELMKAANDLEQATNNAMLTSENAELAAQAAKDIAAQEQAKLEAQQKAEYDKNVLDALNKIAENTAPTAEGGGEGSEGETDMAASQAEAESQKKTAIATGLAADAAEDSAENYKKYLAAMEAKDKPGQAAEWQSVDPSDSLNALLDSQEAMEAFGRVSGEARDQWLKYQSDAEKAIAEGDMSSFVQNMAALGQLISETNRVAAAQKEAAEKAAQEEQAKADKLAAQQGKALGRLENVLGSDDYIDAWSDANQQQRDQMQDLADAMGDAIEKGNWQEFNSNFAALNQLIGDINTAAEQAKAEAQQQALNAQLAEESDYIKDTLNDTAVKQAETATQSAMDFMADLGTQADVDAAIVQEYVDAANALMDSNADLVNAAGQGSRLGDAYEKLAVATAGDDLNALIAGMAEFQGALTATKESQQEQAAGGVGGAATTQGASSGGKQQTEAELFAQRQADAYKHLEQITSGAGYQNAWFSGDHEFQNQSRALRDAIDQAIENGDWDSVYDGLTELGGLIRKTNEARETNEQAEYDEAKALSAAYEQKKKAKEAPQEQAELTDEIQSAAEELQDLGGTVSDSTTDAIVQLEDANKNNALITPELKQILKDGVQQMQAEIAKRKADAELAEAKEAADNVLGQIAQLAELTTDDAAAQEALAQATTELTKAYANGTAQDITKATEQARSTMATVDQNAKELAGALSAGQNLLDQTAGFFGDVSGTGLAFDNLGTAANELEAALGSKDLERIGNAIKNITPLLDDAQNTLKDYQNQQSARQAEAEEAAEQNAVEKAANDKRRQAQIDAANALINENADLIGAAGQGSNLGKAYEALTSAMENPETDFGTLQARIAEFTGEVSSYLQTVKDSFMTEGVKEDIKQDVDEDFAEKLHEAEQSALDLLNDLGTQKDVDAVVDKKRQEQQQAEQAELESQLALTQKDIEKHTEKALAREKALAEQREAEAEEALEQKAVEDAANTQRMAQRAAEANALINANEALLNTALGGDTPLDKAYKALNEAITGDSFENLNKAISNFEQALSDYKADLEQQQPQTQEQAQTQQQAAKAAEEAAAAERQARAEAAEEAKAALADASQNYTNEHNKQVHGVQGANKELTAAYDQLAQALTDETKTSEDIRRLTDALNDLNHTQNQERAEREKQNAINTALQKDAEEQAAREELVGQLADEAEYIKDTLSNGFEQQQESTELNAKSLLDELETQGDIGAEIRAQQRAAEAEEAGDQKAVDEAANTQRKNAAKKQLAEANEAMQAFGDAVNTGEMQKALASAAAAISEGNWTQFAKSMEDFAKSQQDAQDGMLAAQVAMEKEAQQAKETAKAAETQWESEEALYDRAGELSDQISDYIAENGLDGNEGLWNLGKELENAYRQGSDNIEQLVQNAEDALSNVNSVDIDATGDVSVSGGGEVKTKGETKSLGGHDEQEHQISDKGVHSSGGGGKTETSGLRWVGRKPNVTGIADYVTTNGKMDAFHGGAAWIGSVLANPALYEAYQQFQSMASLNGDAELAEFGAQLLEEWGVAAEQITSLSSAQLSYIGGLYNQAAAEAAAAPAYDAWEFEGIDITTQSVDINGGEHTQDEISDYLNGIFEGGASNVADLLAADNPANGGWGIVTNAEYFESEQEAPATDITTDNVTVNGNVDLNARPQISGQQMLDAGWQDFANNLGDYATLFSNTFANNGMTALATPIGANGTVYTPYDFINYVSGLMEQAGSVADLISMDNPANGGLGLMIAAMAGESEATIQAMNELGQSLSQSQAEMYGQSAAAGGKQEVNVETKNANVEVSGGNLGISSDLQARGQSVLADLQGSSYAAGARPSGEALSDTEVQAVNSAIGSLKEALSGDNTQALSNAMNTAQQIMQGNIATTAPVIEAPAPVSSGSGGGSTGTTTIKAEVETPEIPTPDVPAVQIPVEVESAEVPTPDAPSVTIPVSYSGPGELSIPSPGGVTIPVSWGDPGPMPTGGGSGGGSTYTFSGTMAAASGTEHSVAGRYLVDERGAELIEHVSKGTYEMGTNSGARFTKLDAGDIVHNAKETKRILGRGGATHGTAFANASDAGIGGSRQVKAEVSTKPTRVDVVPAFSVEVTFSGSSSSAGVTGSNGNLQSAVSSWDAEKWRIDSIKKAMEEAEKQAAKATRYSDSKSSESTGIGNDFLEWLKKLIDWIPTYLSVLKKKTTAFINATDDAIHYLSKNQLIDDAINNVSEEIKANIQATLRYADFLKTMEGKGISSNIAKKVRNGTIDISEYGDEDTVKSIQAYQEYWNKLVACREALQSLNAQMEALSKQKLDNVVSYFDRIDSLLKDQQKTFESLLDMKKQYGQELTVSDYTDSMSVMEQMLANARKEEAALVKELQEQLGVGGDLVNAILKGGREIWDDISEHIKKNTYNGIVDELLPQAEEAEKAAAEERKAKNTVTQSSKVKSVTKGTTTWISQNGKLIKVQGTGKTLAELTSESNERAAAAEAGKDDTPNPDIDFSTVDIPVEPITDEEIIELGEKLGLIMADGSEEALANFETIKSLLTTSWEHPLAIGSDTWYEYMSTLENLRESIYSTQTEIGELKDEMADIPLTNLKTGFAYLENIRQNLEDTNSLLDAQGSSKYPDTFRSLISVGMKQIENLQEQNKLIQEQMDSLDPLSEKYQELRSSLNGNLDTIADIRKNQEEWNDEIIDLQIDRLKKQNDTYKEQLRLMQALDNLEDARQRKLLVYHDEGGFRYEADEDALEDAQEAANDAIFSSMISGLEKAKENSNIYGPLGERLISGNSIVDSLGNTLVPVTDKLSGLNFEPYYQSIVAGAEQSGLLTSMLNSIDMAKLLEASIGGDVNIDISGMTLNEVNSVKELGDAIIDQLPGYLMQALYQKGA